MVAKDLIQVQLHKRDAILFQIHQLQILQIICFDGKPNHLDQQHLIFPHCKIIQSISHQLTEQRFQLNESDYFILIAAFRDKLLLFFIFEELFIKPRSPIILLEVFSSQYPPFHPNCLKTIKNHSLIFCSSISFLSFSILQFLLLLNLRGQYWKYCLLFKVEVIRIVSFPFLKFANVDNKIVIKQSINSLQLILYRLNFIMKIQKYLSIPKDSFKRKRYLCLLKIFISVATAVLIISFQKIYLPIKQATNMFKIVPLLLIMLFIQLFFNINFQFKNRKYVKSKLQLKAQLQIKSIILPAFTKIIFFVGAIFTSINIYTMDISITAWICFSFIQYYRVKVEKEEFGFKNWMISALVTIGLVITPLGYYFQWSLLNNLFILTFGSLSLLSFYSLHFDLFKIYQTPVQQLIAKQNILQIVIVSCVGIVYLFANYDISEWGYIKTNIGYIFIIGIVALIYDYTIFQLIKKVGYGEIFQTQLTSLIWINIYNAISRGDLSLRMYFSSMIFGIILVSTSQLLEMNDIKKIISKLQGAKIRRRQLQLNQDL